MTHRLFLTACIFVTSSLILPIDNAYSQKNSLTRAKEALDQMFARADTNNDGLVTRREYSSSLGAAFYRKFRLADKNGDGVLNKREFVCVFTPGCAEYRKE